jgi:hypothetical protein
VVDGAIDRKVYGLLVNSYLNSTCLYLGDLHPDLEAAAPHLVQLDYDDAGSRQLLEAAWGNHWGIFLRADTTLQELRRHLRRLLVVRDESGKKLLFRFYDPRVMRTFLPTCTAEELRKVFGPVTRIVTETPESGEPTEFILQGAKLVTREPRPAVD